MLNREAVHFKQYPSQMLFQNLKNNCKTFHNLNPNHEEYHEVQYSTVIIQQNISTDLQYVGIKSMFFSH